VLINSVDHDRLESEVIAHATAHGWVVGCATYHTVMAEKVREALSRCWDDAALYIRGRADRCAVKNQRCILFECKTNPGPWLRASIEALPLSRYVRLGVPCLYIYRDRQGTDFAFWTTDLPTIDVIFLPDRFPELDRFYRARLEQAFPGVEIQSLWGTNGSGDPFAVIRPESLIEKSIDWKSVFVDPERLALTAPAVHEIAW
jgi:hypothetical protein